MNTYIPKGRFFWYAYDALTYIGAVSKHAEGMSLRCDVICALAYCDGHESSHIIKAHADSTKFNKKMVCGNLCLFVVLKPATNFHELFWG